MKRGEEFSISAPPDKFDNATTIKLVWDDTMTMEDVQAFEAWLDLVKAKIRRTIQLKAGVSVVGKVNF